MEEVLERFGGARTLAIAAMGIGLMTFFGYLMMRANQPDMALLFGQIEPAEGGRVIDRLKTMGIPFEVKGDGTQIYAPTDEVAKLRMELAQDGMPSGGGVGYEIFDKQDILGSTNALLGINQIRALEGELGKSIRTIGGIQAARVHLVVPKRELFSENRQEPSASVMVRMKGSAVLSATQVQSIRYLVSSAVPGLALDKVSIVDDRGNLLARAEDSKESKDSFAIQQTAQREYEQRISKSVEALLDRTLGLNKTRAEVNVDMDFDQVSSTSVQYDPEGQVVKTQTTTEEGGNSNESSANEAISVQNALPGSQEAGAAGGGSKNTNQTNNTEENIHYEISNTTKTFVKELGAIKRLSIAVMVDGTYKKKPDGTQEYQARSEDELKKLKELVKTATGFKEDRGDVLSLVNLKFSELPQDSIPEEKEKPFLGLNLNKLIELGITALVVLIGLFTVIKPIASSLGKSSSSSSKSSTELAEKMFESISQAMPEGYNQAYPQYQGQGSGPANLSGPPGNRSAGGVSHIKAPQENSLVYLDNQSPDVRLKKSGIAPNVEQSMINVDQIENLAKQSSIKKIAEIIDRHPEEAVEIIRTWMYSGK